LRCTDRGIDRVEPPGHAFAQYQSKADTPRLRSHLWRQRIASSGSDDL
jgi:hypothetical protein